MHAVAVGVVGNEWSYSEGMYVSEEQGALPMLEGGILIPALVSFMTAKIHHTHLRDVACLTVLQGGNEGEKEQKEKNIREGFFKNLSFLLRCRHVKYLIC